MAKICQKCGYERTVSDIAPSYECPKCGAVYAKVGAQLERKRFEEQQAQEKAARRIMSASEVEAERERLFGNPGKSKTIRSGGLSSISNRTWIVIGLVAANVLIWSMGDFSNWHPFGIGTPERNTYRENANNEGELIPRTMQEKANYYLISVEQDGNFLRTLHSRVSAMSHGYSVTRIDCENRRYQDLGYGEDAQSNIKMYDKAQWTDLVTGSSKFDLATFVCARPKR